MKNQRLALAAALLCLAACGESGGGPTTPPAPTPTPTSIVVTPADTTLRLEDTVRFTARVLDQSGREMPGAQVTWESTNLEVAVAGADGRVEASGAGDAQVTATAGTVRKAVQVRVQPDFASVTAGADHACGLDPAGRAYCWGNNRVGQLGMEAALPECLPGHPCSTRPVAVAGDLRFRAISARWLTTCGLTLEGTVFCWGLASTGVTGVVTTDPLAKTPTPRQIPGLSGVQAVSAGGHHACALLGDGTVRCWGLNDIGQLGAGPTAPARCSSSQYPCSPTPVHAAAGRTFASITAGERSTCGVTTGGDLYCWGETYPRSGGVFTDAPKPDVCSGASCYLAPAKLFAGARVQSLGIGREHACLLTDAGKAYCWGENYSQALGLGTWGSYTYPQPVAGGLSFRSISAGVDHTCAVATDGKGYCWGSNGNGERGTPTYTFGEMSEISGDHRFSSLVSNINYSCGITSRGMLFCWGENWYGQLGNGESGLFVVPKYILPQRVRRPA
jgi:alpha-tubulin suppressor-like RCC1 family protein